MSLTAQQTAALKAYIQADPDGLGFAPLVAAGDAGGIQALLNAKTPAFSVLDPAADANAILDAILLANYTPAAAVATANAQVAALYCQAKQNNLFLLLQRPNQTTFDATKPNNVAGLKDATLQLPSKADLSNQTGGWTGATVTVPMRLVKTATYFQKLFAVANTTAAAGPAGLSPVPAMNDGASPAGTAPTVSGVGAPALMVLTGSCQIQDVQTALAP